MKFNITIEKKALYLFIVYIFFISILFVTASTIPSGEVGHTGENILVDVWDSEKTLQAAIENDFVIFSGDSVSFVLSECTAMTPLAWVADDGNYYNAGGRSWSVCPDGKVFTGIQTYIYDLPYDGEIAPEGVGELFSYAITCCSIEVV